MDRRGESDEDFGIKIAGVAGACLLALAGLGFGPAAWAQGTGSIHGKVISPLGAPVKEGSVRLTTDKAAGDATKKKYDYTFPLDSTGNFKGEGIKPGNYAAVAFQGNTSVDFNMSLAVAAGDDKTVDFDMTRKEYIDKMSPEEKAEVEEMKKQNAAAMANNAKVENLNTLLKQARDSNKAGKYDDAIKAMTDATAAKPDEALLWDTLGDAQLGQAMAAEKAAKNSHAIDASLPDKYATAVASYQKALTLNGAATKPNPELTATVNNQLGQALGRTGKTKEAAESYETAARWTPRMRDSTTSTRPRRCLNANDYEGANAAADKAIAADPTKADAYYIKGQALIQKLTIDEKTQKPVPPPGMVEAYQKYLELAPEGSHATDVKGILEGIGQPIKSTYKAGKK